MTDINPPNLNEDDIQIDFEAPLEGVEKTETETPSKSAEEGIEDLRRRLEDERAERQRATEARDAAEQARLKAANEAEEWRRTAISREQQAAESSLSRAEQAAANAKAKARAAYEAGDYDAVVEAQEELARQTYAAEQIKRELEIAKSRPQPRQQEPDNDPLKGMPARTKEWLKAHPDVMRTPAMSARAQAAHYDAIDAGHAFESDGYFAAIEERLGYRKAEDDKPREERPKRDAGFAAPPSREAPSRGRQSSTIVRLSKEQREFAAACGIPEEEYAKQYAKDRARV